MKGPDRAIRLDVLIAVCALLVSSLATLASWLQSRESARQTQVLEQQLSAQVWPYVSVSEALDGSTARITIENDGLGPAILKSLTATVDRKEQANLVDATHAMLGTHLVHRRPRGEAFGFDLSNFSPGSVIRPGDSESLLRLKSQTFAPRFIAGFARLQLRLCYCAILPGKCWIMDTASVSSEPPPVSSCPLLPRDVLHSNVMPNVRTM